MLNEKELLQYKAFLTAQLDAVENLLKGSEHQRKLRAQLDDILKTVADHPAVGDASPRASLPKAIRNGKKTHVTWVYDAICASPEAITREGLINKLRPHVSALRIDNILLDLVNRNRIYRFKNKSDKYVYVVEHPLKTVKKKSLLKRRSI